MTVLRQFVFILLLLGSNSAFSEYQFPIKNPVLATISGTPDTLKITQKDLRIRQPDYVNMSVPDSQFMRPIDKEYTLSVFSERVIPDVFWYEKGGLKYSVAQHDVKAPLIFIIAGTGASYRSASVKALQRIFYQAGYHVVAISSPTVLNFMLNASTSVIPGNLREDSQDIYQVMKKIMEKHHALQVSDFYLTGYSLGGSHAAFVSQLDDQKGHFQFKKVLLINPPLSLTRSVDILDKMFEDNIPGGIDNFNVFFDQLITKVSKFYRENEELGLTQQFFYEIFKQQTPTEEEMKTMIGFVFRMASAGMVFGADVYNRQGYIVPKKQVELLNSTSSLTGYAKVAHRLGFNDYIEQFYLPVFEQKTGLSSQQLIEQSSLESIKNYLQKNDRIGVMHNHDDPILAPGEIEVFKILFPDRITLYQYGGHMGNLQFKQNVFDMLDFFNASSRLSDSSNTFSAIMSGGELQ